MPTPLSTRDRELTTIRAAVRALDTMTVDAQDRVIQYLGARYRKPAPFENLLEIVQNSTSTDNGGVFEYPEPGSQMRIVKRS